jgi:hypothetical protein
VYIATAVSARASPSAVTLAWNSTTLEFHAQICGIPCSWNSRPVECHEAGIPVSIEHSKLLTATPVTLVSTLQQSNLQSPWMSRAAAQSWLTIAPVRWRTLMQRPSLEGRAALQDGRLIFQAANSTVLYCPFLFLRCTANTPLTLLPA